MMGMRAALASVILLMLINLSVVSATTTVTFQPGAYIIDMGSFPYTYATGLKPYGLVYDLVINKQIPLYWAINPAKAKDGVDFTATTNSSGTKSYRAGSVIIPYEFVAEAMTTINTWKAKGVIVDGGTSSAITVQIYDTLTSFPKAVCDEQNGPLIINAFYIPSEVPSSSYRIGNPLSLNDCDDIYALPHADPHQWIASWKTTFYNFINNGGDLWNGCHSPSALEGPASLGYAGWYFLTTNGLVPWGDHDDASPPYSYNASSATHPVMQFVGYLDNALQSGSEQVYLPRIGSSWRGSSTVAVWDPTQSDVPSLSAGPAGIVIYGYAFGNTSKGFIVYEASHNFLTGNTSEDVDAARVYGNFLLYSGINNRPNLTANVPPKMLSGSTGPVNVSIAMGSGKPPFTVTWSSSCGGTFANPTSTISTPPYIASTTFTAPTVTSVTSCILRVTVTDACGRRNFMALPVTIYPVMMTLTKTDYKQAVQKEETLPYEIRYSNTGPITAENVVITDLLPLGVTYIPTAFPAPASVTYNGNGTTTVVWNLGNVPAGASKLMRLNATVNLSASGSLTNNVQSKAYIAGLGPVYRTAKDTDILSPITKSVNRTTASAGDYLNYSICTRYDEPFLLRNATVKDTIPDYTTYVINSTNAGGTYFAANKTIIWQLGSNEPGISSSTHPGTNTVNIPATYDTYVSSGNQLIDYGKVPALLISSASQRALLYFSLSTIPPSATINSATFNATVTSARANADISIRRLLRNWCMQANQCVLPCTGLIVEGKTDNNGDEPDTFAEGYGSTWNNYLYKKTYLSCPWTTAGGDYDKVKSFGTFALTGTAGTRTVTGAALMQLVQGWYNGTYANQGIVLDTITNSNAFIGSRENTNGAAYWPQLSVTYYTTSPGSPTTVSVYAMNDTYLSLNSPNINYGKTPTLGIRGSGNGNDMRSLIYFPFNQLNIPAGATITSATLRVYLTTAIGGGAGPVATVRRSTRSWCLQGDQCYNLCQGMLLEGRTDNNGDEPDTLAEGYGTVWNFYYYNEFAAACQWTGNSVNNDIGTSYPPGFSAATTGNKGAVITSLVQGWYNGSIANQGIALVSDETNSAAIASREATAPANRPYIRVSYTVGQGTNTSITARPLLSCEGGQIVVKMTVNTSANDTTITAPGSLNVDVFNATIALASGPTPASYSNVPALSNRTFTYVYNVTSNGYPGTVAFTGKPATPTYYATATSNKLLVTPRLTYTVQIPPYPTTPNTVNTINNTARFRDEAVVPDGVDSNEVVTALIWPRNIQVTKSANISQGVECNNVLFSLAVKNTGLANLVTVEVEDTLPAGLEYVSSPNGSVNGQIITWANIGPMAPGQTKTLTVVAHFNGDAFGLLNNTVWVRGTTINGNNVTNSSYKVVQALKTDISGTKTPDKLEGPPSTTINFTMTMTNSGEAALAPASMKDIFPAGMDFVSSNPAPNSSDPVNSTYIWSWPSLAPGATKTVVVKTHLNGEYFGEICNPVFFTGKTPSGLYVINQSSSCVYAQEPGIAINKTFDFATGDKCHINYSINVTNTGEVPLYPVTLVDYLPAGMEFISSNGGVNSSNTITWPAFGPLANGSSQLFYVLARIKHPAEGSQNNRANVTAKSSTGLSYSAEDWENFTAHAVGLEVSKGASPKEAGLLQNVTFTINVTNTGNTTLNPVTVIDALPAGLAYGSDNQSGTAVGSTITWANVGPLSPGAYTNISLVTYVDGAAAGLVENTVDATGKPDVGCDITDEDKESVTIYTKTDFTVTKTALNESVEPGDNAVFIINVTNIGDIALSTVKVVDVLPIGLVYVSDNSTPPATVSGNLVTWNNVGPLAPGASKFIQLIAKVVL